MKKYIYLFLFLFNITSLYLNAQKTPRWVIPERKCYPYYCCNETFGADFTYTDKQAWCSYDSQQMPITYAFTTTQACKLSISLSACQTISGYPYAESAVICYELKSQFGEVISTGNNSTAIENIILADNKLYILRVYPLTSYPNLFYTSICTTLTGQAESGSEIPDEFSVPSQNMNFEYKNKEEQTVLSRESEYGTPHDTYYVYDDYGNLTFVLPPIAVELLQQNDALWTIDNCDALKLYAYAYKYDEFNRCVWKKLPGADPIYYKYDEADNLIFSQDGEQREKGEWTFSIPDHMGRIVLTGICKNPPEIRSIRFSAYYSGDGSYFGYKMNAYNYNFELDDVKIHTVNFYDNYNFMGKNNIPTYSYDSGYEGDVYGKWDNRNPAFSHKGLLTGTITALLDWDNTDKYLYSVMYYDYRKRLIQAHSSNHLNGKDTEYVAYDFTGNPIEKIHDHYVPGKGGVYETNKYTYDHAGRLLETTHKVNNRIEVVLAKNEYDELGRIRSKEIAGQPRLKTQYDYNVRSWITEINNPNFNQRIYYNEDFNGRNQKAYNGNISAISWNRGENTSERSYVFTYDPLSRLKAAAFGGTGGEDYTTSYSYDKHGNMLTLNRKGRRSGSADDYGDVDRLTFSYTGNQLKTVTDNVTGILYEQSADFKGNATGEVHYTFNKNGAMTQDLNKGISGIQYNSLNLPQTMVINSSTAKAKNYYTYSASGVKLKVEQRFDPNLLTNPVESTTPENDGLSDSKLTDYVGNKIYENRTLKKVLIDGGYYDYREGKYYFYIHDHLGNNRAVADNGGNVVQKNDYYPFGMEFADNTGSDVQDYKYNGKELDKMHRLNWYDYMTRYLANDVPRFPTMDWHAENYYNVSPYVYCLNNPLKYVDPSGMDTIHINQDGTPQKYPNGSIVSHPGGEDNVFIVDQPLPEIVKEAPRIYKSPYDYIGLSFSGAAVVGIGITLTLNIGYVPNDGLFLNLAGGAAYGLDVSVSGNQVYGFYKGDQKASALSMYGMTSDYSLGAGLLNYSNSEDIVLSNPRVIGRTGNAESKRWDTTYGENWETHAIGITIGSKSIIGGYKSIFSDTSKPLFLYKEK